MAKRPSENSTADRSFRALRPEDFTYPEGEVPQETEKPKGQPNWSSVRSRQSGTFDAIEKQREIDRLKAEIEKLEKKEEEGEELIIGGQ